jgi:hypothetical protein
MMAWRLFRVKTVMRHVRWTGLLAVLLVLTGLLGCGTNQVDEAEVRWQNSGLVNYRIRLREFHSIWCFYDVGVEVRGGQVVAATATAHYGPAQSCGYYGDRVVDEPASVPPDKAAHWTVPALLETARTVEECLGKAGWRARLEFDPELGYPLTMALDDEQALDDDWSISVVHLERIEP